MAPIRSLAILLATALGAAVLTTAPAASAEVLDVTCTPPSSNIATYNPALTLTPQTVTVVNTAQYGPCTSASQPTLASGTRTSVNVSSRSCLDLLAATPIAFTVTWNTGQTSTISGNSTTTIAGAVVTFTLTGTVTSGLFAGSTVVQANVAPSASLLLCTAGLGTVPSFYSLVTLEITSA
ncbi:hypothetical protein HCN51_45905 [Nonomuraea sp. FMUSA5-5]|uniref:Ig-like domain-containing protein n=1 Tax=Nonomuraea composti TaxID=2720023 RepID=A0ABX1BG12_9ACTN|nr:hypothetical protein [Nonomuraea sp. FMUSA5-5]NJP96685.1 hypothetical protein [Nonomuraea sp. FMUSA5-5]